MGILNRKTYFAYARKAPFGNRLTQQQVDGMNDLLDYWEAHHNDKPASWLGYILATVFHETGGKMVPVREGFAQSDAQARRVVAKRRYGAVGVYGFVPYGRGRVQVTWDRNYKRLEERFGLPFTENPELLLDSDIDAMVAVEGHIEGLWTGKKLSDYFSDVQSDSVNARRIVNGTDKARLISGYFDAFMGAINAARASEELPEDIKPADAEPDAPQLATDKTVIGTLTSVAGAGGLGFLSAVDNPWALAAVGLVLFGVYLFLTGRLDLRRRAGA